MFRFNPSVILPVLALAAAPTLFGAHPARAGSVVVENGSYVQHVSPIGLDLSTPAGREALRTRVRLAAGEVCSAGGGAAVLGSLGMLRCIHEAYWSAQGLIETALTRPAAAQAKLASR